MDPRPAPVLENDLPPGLYTDEEKAAILAQIEAEAQADRMPFDEGAFRPRKSGIFFPLMVNAAALVLIVGAWFGAEALFQLRQDGLKLKTDQLFSTESKLLAEVLAKSKAQLAEKNAEIDTIKGDLAKSAAEKANLQKTMGDKIAQREKVLKKELDDTLAAERKRLEALGIDQNEVARRLKEFEAQKNAEFTARLDTYRSQAQAEIDRKDAALVALQAQLKASEAEQNRIQKDLATQTQARERDLKTQVDSQTQTIDQLKKERDELVLFQRQAEASMAAVKSSWEAGDRTKTQQAVTALRQVLARASASASDLVRSRAQAEAQLVSALDGAVVQLEAAPAKAAEADARLEAMKAQAKKEQALAALQLSETQKTLADTEAKYKKAQADTEALRQNLADASAAQADANAKNAEAASEAQALQERIAALEQTVAELNPWKEKVTALQGYFTATYPTAKERFSSTFGSEAGLSLFPSFNQVWSDLLSQSSPVVAAAPVVDQAAIRRKALEDVLSYTAYLKGTSPDANGAKSSAEALVKNDEAYRKVVEDIQSLAKTGVVETIINTSPAQLFGTVAALSGNRLLVEPLTKVKVAEGQVLEVRRTRSRQVTVVGQGPVLSVSATKVEVDWTGQSGVPQAGDGVYLVAR